MEQHWTPTDIFSAMIKKLWIPAGFIFTVAFAWTLILTIAGLFEPLLWLLGLRHYSQPARIADFAFVLARLSVIWAIGALLFAIAYNILRGRRWAMIAACPILPVVAMAGLWWIFLALMYARVGLADASLGYGLLGLATETGVIISSICLQTRLLNRNQNPADAPNAPSAIAFEIAQHRNRIRELEKLQAEAKQ